MSREIWFDLKRKAVFKRAQEIKIEPKLSAEVCEGLRELYQMEKEA